MLGCRWCVYIPSATNYALGIQWSSMMGFLRYREKYSYLPKLVQTNTPKIEHPKNSLFFSPLLSREQIIGVFLLFLNLHVVERSFLEQAKLGTHRLTHCTPQHVKGTQGFARRRCSFPCVGNTSTGTVSVIHFISLGTHVFSKQGHATA